MTFSEPIQPSSANDSDIFALRRDPGHRVRAGVDQLRSDRHDPHDHLHQLPTDAYQFTLVAGPGNFLSTAGVPLQSSYVDQLHDARRHQHASPACSRSCRWAAWSTTPRSTTLLSLDRFDTYDLTIDPEQTLAVLATPVTSSMSDRDPDLAVGQRDRHGDLASPARRPLLPGVQSAKGGTYQIVVTGGAGRVHGHADLNALVDPASYGGTPNGSIATATPIDPYANKFAGNDDRTAVLGTIAGRLSASATSLVRRIQDDVTPDRQDHRERPQHVHQSRLLRPDLFDVALAKDNTFYVLGDFNRFTGVIVHMNLQGQTLGEFTLPVSDNPGYLSPEGFGYDPSDGSFWVPLINSAHVMHVDASGNF